MYTFLFLIFTFFCIYFSKLQGIKNKKKILNPTGAKFQITMISVPNLQDGVIADYKHFRIQMTGYILISMASNPYILTSAIYTF